MHPSLPRPPTAPARAAFAVLGGALLGALLLLPSAGCQSTKDLPPYMVTFHFEATADQAAEEAVLPKSGLTIRYVKQAPMTAADLRRIELNEVMTPVGRQYAFSFQFKEGFGYNKLAQQTTMHQGNKLIAFVGTKPIAAWRVDAPLRNGNLMMWSEVPDDQVEDVTLDVQESLAKLQEIQRKK